VIIFLLTPTLLQTIYSVNPITALKANLVASGVLVVSSVLAGLLVDRIGGGWHLLVGSILLGVATFLLYTEILYHPNWLPWLYALVGLCSGVFVAVPYIMINSFPPPVRFSGIATSYNCASAIVGGMTPVVVTYSIRANPMAHMYCVVVVCALGALTGALLIGRPESKS
jgi:MFS family permease